MIIFLTGQPGIGKSSIIETVINHFKPKCHGILAKEIKSANERIGFTAINHHGKTHQFMTKTNNPSKFSLGMYDVNLDVIDKFIVPEILQSMSDDNSFIYIDEIGRAQMMSDKFIATIRSLLISKKNILATIVFADEPKSKQFKKDPRACILEVTHENRTILPKILIAAFEQADLFNRLDEIQQKIVYNLLIYFIGLKQYISAIKLFTNALDYTINKKIRLELETSEQAVYIISGQTSEHTISYNKSHHHCQCDCSLFNGAKDFIGSPQTCSHEMTILLTERLQHMPKQTFSNTSIFFKSFILSKIEKNEEKSLRDKKKIYSKL